MLRLLETAPPPLERWQLRLFVAAAAAVGLTRLLAVAATPWEWDEMLFALALRDYDVAAHHPHPPGFPFFVLLAKLVSFAAPDPFRSLQAVTVASSLLLLPALFLLARELRLPFRIAMIGSALCAFFPNVWLFGGTAFSDVTSLVLVSTAVALLLRGCRSGPALTAGAILLAFAAGVRPQNLVIGAIPALLATASRLRQRDFLRLFLSIGGGAVLTALLYGGAALATGSFERYSAAVADHRAYILREDSFLDPDRSPLPSVFADFFFRQYSFHALGHLVSLFVLIGIARAIFRREKPLLLLAAAFVPFFLLAVLLLDRFSMTRFAIGYAPLFAFLAASGIDSVSAWLARARVPPARIATAISLALIGGFTAWMFRPLESVRTKAAPSAAAFKWVSERPPSAVGTLYVASTLQPFGDYYMRDVPTTLVIDGDAWIIDGRPGTLVSQGRRPDAVAQFERSEKRLRKITRSHYYAVAVAPLDRRASFSEGWSPPLREGTYVMRPLADQGVIVLPGGDDARHLKLQFEAGAPDSIRVEWNGAVLFAGALAPGRHLLQWPIGGKQQREENVVRIAKSETTPAGNVRLLALSWGASVR